MWVVVLAPRKVGVLIGMLVPGVTLLALGEVAAPRIMDARMTGLLALGEVTAVVLLEGVARFFLTGGEAVVLVVVVMLVMLAMLAMLAVVVVVVVVVMLAMLVVVTVIMTVLVVGMFAHARVSQRLVSVHCGPPVKRW